MYLVMDLTHKCCVSRLITLWHIQRIH